jgi:hypothetical protein
MRCVSVCRSDEEEGGLMKAVDDARNGVGCIFVT